MGGSLIYCNADEAVAAGFPNIHCAVDITNP
jgi:hypothetical protein